jgi:hypothetical protein
MSTCASKPPGERKEERGLVETENDEEKRGT